MNTNAVNLPLCTHAVLYIRYAHLMENSAIKKYISNFDFVDKNRRFRS